jgi:cell division protein FtsB
MINPITKSILVLLSLTLMLSLYLITTTEYELLDLRRLKNEKESLIVKNSVIGLEILGQINILERLAKNDLKLIEHIARSELRMVGKNELILIPKERQEISSIESQDGNKPKNFRILTEEEFDKLLSFDTNSFKFHDKLKDSHEYGGGKEGSPQPNQKDTSGIADATNKPEAENKFSSFNTITIQVAAFRNRRNAENLIKKLKEKGYSAYLVDKNSENSVWYKVKIGNINDNHEAKSVLRALKRDGYKPIIVREAKPHFSN